MPLSAVQILWINLATDTLPALALGVDPINSEILNEKPKKRDSFMDKALIKRVICNGLVMALLTITAYLIGYKRSLYLGKTFDVSNAIGQTMAFCVLAFSQLIHAFNQRSNKDSIFSAKMVMNKYLVLALVISFGLIFAILFIPFFQNIFNFTNLDLSEWLIVISFSFFIMFINELFKIFRYHKR